MVKLYINSKTGSIVRKEEIHWDKEIIADFDINDRLIIEDGEVILWDKSKAKKEFIKSIKDAEPEKGTEDHLVWENVLQQNK